MPNRPSPGLPSAEALPHLICACASARRAARLISQVYGNHLREYGTEPAQMSMLMALAHVPGKSQVALTRMLGIDKTSLSRNLSLLKKKGIVESAPVPGQREPGFFLTPAGQKRLKSARIGWSRAQSEVHDAMTAREWDSMLKTFDQVARVAQAIQTRYENSPGRIQ